MAFGEGLLVALVEDCLIFYLLREVEGFEVLDQLGEGKSARPHFYLLASAAFELGVNRGLNSLLFLRGVAWQLDGFFGPEKSFPQGRSSEDGTSVL